MNRRNPARGFTLVELMVTIAIIAIVSAIAIPSYQQYTRESRRASAYAALTDAVSRQEQFFLDNKTYTATVSGGGLNMAATTEGGYYALSVDAPGAGCPIASCYVLRAAPQLSQVADTCGELTISSMGQKLPQGCW